ncbi:hypothetical protein GCM10023259_020640 [Thermocatellispora tengchongensis]
MELFGVSFNVTVPKPVAQFAWVVILILVVVIVLVRYGAVMSFTIG